MPAACPRSAVACGPPTFVQCRGMEMFAGGVVFCMVFVAGEWIPQSMVQQLHSLILSCRAL